MESFIAWAWIIGIFGGFWIIVKIFKLIGNALEKRRQRIRDEAARDVFSRIDIDFKKENEELKKRMTNEGFDLVIETVPKKLELSVGPKERVEKVDKCPKCIGGFLIKRVGRYGFFYGCSNYPGCKNTRPYKKRLKQSRTGSGDTIVEKIKKAYL